MVRRPVGRAVGKEAGGAWSFTRVRAFQLSRSRLAAAVGLQAWMTVEGPRDWRDRQVSATEAVSAIRPGDQVFIGSACATPHSLVEALEQAKRPGVTLVHFLTSRVAASDPPQTSAIGIACFTSGATSSACANRVIAWSICRSRSLTSPACLRERQIPLDVAMVQVAPPGPDDTCSLGISVDVTRAAALAARTVIAEVNTAMPRTAGDSWIPLDRIASFVSVDTPIVEYLHESADEVAEQIARYVARLIDDRSTLQVGLGRVPNQMLARLTNRRGLAIHSDVITEPIVDLVAAGVVTGPVTTSWAMGTRRLYDLVENDPRFAFHPIEYVCDPTVIASRERMVSVTQAFTIDLTGQVSTETVDGALYGGVSTGPAFHRGALASPGGMAIVCLASRTPAGRSAVVLDLAPGEAVAIPRADVHWVITEYGTAYLFGRSLAERAVALIEISHPDFRRELLDAAIERGLVGPKQQLRSRTAYPVAAVRDVRLRDGPGGAPAPDAHQRHRRDARALLPAQRGGCRNPVLAKADLAHRLGRAVPMQCQLRPGDGFRRRGRPAGARAHRRRQLLLPQPRKRPSRGGLHGRSGLAERGPRDDPTFGPRRVRSSARRARPDGGRAPRQFAHDARLRTRRALAQREDVRWGGRADDAPLNRSMVALAAERHLLFQPTKQLRPRRPSADTRDGVLGARGARRSVRPLAAARATS